MSAELAKAKTRRRVFFDARNLFFLGLAIAFVCALQHPDLFGKRLFNTDGGSEFMRFVREAAHPTLVSEDDATISLTADIVDAVKKTVAVAFAAIGLAIVLGLFWGLLASEAFWDRDPVVPLSRAARFWRGTLRTGIRAVVRTAMALLRSVHELVWALLFTSLFSVNLYCGIAALAVPFAASYGRICAEILDETPRDSARALRALGGGDTSIFFFGLLPRALPGMLSYTFYRFDCAVRSSAVLGFVGYPTLGLLIRSSFSDLNYREVWTYLYVLFAILALTDVASDAVRRRLAR